MKTFIIWGLIIAGGIWLLSRGDDSPEKLKANIYNSGSQTKSVSSPNQNCHPSYSGCLDPDASDYDCIGGSGNGPRYTGRVLVYGYDEFGLDRDGDGVGCE